MDARTKERVETLKRVLAEARKALKNAIKSGLKVRAHEIKEKIARLEKEHLDLTLHNPRNGIKRVVKI